jgi:outer membrane lipoprotein-sorting protein
MESIVKIKLIVLVLVLFSYSYPAEPEAKIVKGIQQTYEQMKYLTADFSQVEQFKLTGTQNETGGKIYVKGGLKFRLETEDQTVVTDGKTVWTYSVMNNQVLVDRVKEGEGSLLPRDLLFKYPQEYYATLLEETKIDGEKYYLLKLDPREGIHGYIKTMKMWVHVKSYFISRIEFTDFNNNISILEIRQVDTKTELSDSLFIFTPTPEMQIVDLRF